MDKNRQNNVDKLAKVNKDVSSKDHEEYGYDFVPHLNEWLNIDEQKEKTKELEDI